MNGDSQNTPVPPAQPEQGGGQWQYKPEGNQPGPVSAPAPALAPMPGPPAQAPSVHGYHPGAHPEIPDEISWTASEFVAHHKGAGWYGLFIAAAVVVVVILYFITRDFISVFGIVAMMIIFGVAAGRQPRTLSYHLDTRGMTIGPKFYPYSEFKFFSVIEEGAFSSLAFTPLKRFMPPISVYYDPKDEEAIVEVISRHLPLQEGNNDFIDKFARHIRF
ncbi:MAG TPA: hypothetical protein VD735_03865 [Candidatus Saccharimonadales bacterium]|nr:hypothetical protein [Candidatus Saccharimonadales bacterium]